MLRTWWGQLWCRHVWNTDTLAFGTLFITLWKCAKCGYKWNHHCIAPEIKWEDHS